MGIHKGTKLTKAPKTNSMIFRFNNETYEKLVYLSEKYNCSRSEIIRRGIEKIYESSKE